MGMERLAARTRAALVASSDGALRRACGRGARVSLIVPSRAWGQRRKEQLARSKITGVDVLTYSQWLEGLWGVHGDGTVLVSPGQRMVLLRPLLAQVMGAEPSHDMLAAFASCASEALLAPAPPGLSAVEERLRVALDAYKRALGEQGLVEHVQVEEALLDAALPAQVLVCEQPDESCAHEMRFLERLAACGEEVTVLSRRLDGASCPAGAPGGHELSVLAQRLYSGAGGVQAHGAVVVGEAHGAHVEGELVAALLEHLFERGARPRDVTAVFASAADTYPHVQDALARAGVPFECAFELPLQRTAFGAAYLALARWAEDPLDDGSYQDLAGFVASPFSGVDAESARAVQAHWRQRAGSRAPQRLEDLRCGFKRGHAAAKLMAQALQPVVELLDAMPRERVRLMFGHACAACREDALADDVQAANALLAYLDDCEQLGHEPFHGDMACLPVPLERAFDAGDGAVQLVGEAECGLERRPYVLLANLDAQHHPMARRPQPFDALLEKLLGCDSTGLQPGDEALRQRCMLLDALTSAREGFAFYRVCHDREGNESCQSALWDELMEAYRGSGDEDGAPEKIPDALKGHALRLSEAQVFEKEVPVSALAVTRGRLDGELTRRHLAQLRSGDAIVFSPTALEDYYRCPYRWFTSRRTSYRGMDVAFDGAAQGNLAHAVFDAFYRALRARGVARVDADNLSEALALADEVFADVVEQGRDKPRTGLFLRTEMDRLACERVREQVRSFIERDAAFLPGFHPAYLELELGQGDGGVLSYAGVPVRGKVDRVDMDGRGRAVVVDYKLSSLSVGYGLDPERDMPQRIQTDIYATLVQRHFERLGEQVEVVGSVYRSYSANMLRGAYASNVDWGNMECARPERDALTDDRGEGGYRAHLERVEHAVEACLARLHDAEISPRPIASGVCEYCKALGFCPRREA